MARKTALTVAPPPTVSAPVKADERCESCRYFHVLTVPDITYVCRRYPPTAKQPMTVTGFITPSWWCGEYKSKD